MNHDFHVRVAEIRVNQDVDSSRLVECFHVESGKEHPLHLLAIAEITSTSYVYERFLDTLYTSLQQAKTFVSGMDGDPMIRFEKIVQRVNEALSSFAQMEGDALQWDQINLFLFQIADHHLCFSGLGSVSNVFLQKQADGQSKAFDLLGSLEQPERVLPNKPLSAIVCGAMQVGDLLFFGSQNVQTVREQIGITHLCRTLPPVSAATEIEQRLQNLGKTEPYFGVVVAAVQVSRPTPTISTKPPASSPLSSTTTENEADTDLEDASDSIEHLYNTEVATEQLLDQGEVGKNAFFQGLASRLRGTMGNLPSPKQLTEVFARRPLSTLSITASASSVTRVLNTRRQTTIIIVSALIVLVGGGTLFVRHARQKQEEQRVWTAVFEQATEAKNRAESAMVYADEERARTQVQQAVQSLSQLATDTPDRAQAKEGLEKTIRDIQARLRREQVIDQPTVLARLTDQAPDLRARGLVSQNGFFYTINQANNTLVRLPVAGGSLETFNAPDTSPLTLVGNGPQAPILSNEAGGFLTLRNGSLTPLTTTASKAQSKTHIALYGQRIYVLDQVARMIWRWNAGASLSGETAYLSTPLAENERPTSIAIDSSVYVGTENGALLKFLGGKRENWAPMTIDPPLTSIAAVWTHIDASVIAVLDTQQKRLVLFSKEGRLVTQITSPSFTNPQTLWGDAASKTLYLLNEGTIYSIPIPTE